MFKLFQPKGVLHKNYNKYIGWTFVSNIISSTQYVLSTHCMLSTIGKDSVEFNMSYNYIVKDVIGQMGGLYYISKNSSKGNTETKHFLNKSLVIQQGSVYLECLTPIIPKELFLPVAGAGNIGKNITATSLGAVNAKIIQLLSEDEKNIIEIYAKISMLNTIGSSIGMFLGLIIVHYVPDDNTRFCLLPFLSVTRIWTYNNAIKDLL